MRKLQLIPSQAGYGVGLGNEVLSVALAGGPSRTRRDFLGAVAYASVAWSLPLNSYNYLQAFFRTASENASEPFLIDMILDTSLPEEYTVLFVPGSFQLTGVSGVTLTAVAQLEVKPKPVNPVLDEAIMVSFEAYGEDMDLAYTSLSDLVNVDWPRFFSV